MRKGLVARQELVRLSRDNSPTMHEGECPASKRGIKSAQIGDGVADEEGTAIEAFHAGTAHTRLIVTDH